MCWKIYFLPLGMKCLCPVCVSIEALGSPVAYVNRITCRLVGSITKFAVDGRLLQANTCLTRDRIFTTNISICIHHMWQATDYFSMFSIYVNLPHSIFMIEISVHQKYALAYVSVRNSVRPLYDTTYCPYRRSEICTDAHYRPCHSEMSLVHNTETST